MVVEDQRRSGDPYVWTLRLVLRVAGVAMLIALGAVALPHAWMDAVHRRLGLGALPDVPIVSYLSRSLSLLYASQGALLLYLSRDVRRYRDFLRFYALVGLVCGPIMLLVDLFSRLPASWVAGEGPSIAALGGVVYLLATKVGRGPPC